MKVVKLTAENLKRLKCVEITPKGNIVEISGANGAGKSSVLDALFWTLAGTREVQKQPVRHGASEGRTEIELDDLIVRRKFSQTGTTLQVERKSDGVRIDKPQAVLDKLYGRIGFDPLAFSRMKPKEQFEQLRKLVKIEVDVDKLDELNRSDFAKRTDINREIKTLKGQWEGITIAAGLPDQKIDVSALSAKVEEAANHNKNIEIERSRRAASASLRQSALNDIKDNDDTISELRLEIKKLEDRIEATATENETIRSRIVTIDAEIAALPPIPGVIDTSAVRAEINKAVSVNAEIDRRSRKLDLAKQIQDLEHKSSSLTDAMDGREKTKRAAIAAAEFPVEGLGFGSDEVLLGGVPFEQASSAEQLRASCAIAMSMNPELRVIIIRDGSLLDEKSMEILSGLAKDKDFQCWIEVVDTSGTVGVVIEEGVVVADNQKSNEQA